MIAAVRLSLGFLTKRERAIYFWLLALRAVAGLLDVFGILLIGLLTGLGAAQLGGSGKPVVLLGLTLPTLDDAGFVRLVVFVLAVFAIKAVIAVMLSKALTSFIARVESENATKIADLILRGSLGEMQRFSKAEVQWAVMGSTVFAFTGLLNSVATIITESVLLLLIGATFIFVDPLAALLVTVYFVGIILIIQFVIGPSLKRAGMDATTGNVETASAVNDTLDTFREISVLSKQDLFLERFAVSRARLARSGGMMAFLGGMPRYVVETALILGVVVFVGWLFLNGQLSTGLVTIGVFLTGGVRIMASLLPLQNAAAQIKSHVEQAKLAQDLLVEAAAAEKAAAADRNQAPPQVVFAPDGGLALVVDDVEFRYPDSEEPALRDVSLRIEGGRHVALIGPSGAGKTTLVDLVLGLIKPSRGTVTIGGIEPRLLSISHPGLIAYVPQNPGLVSGTIAENIALGVPPEKIDYDRIDEVLEYAHLTQFIATLAQGTQTTVGKQADALSGGQVQRLGLARALYPNPRLLILDEATSALDAGSEAFVSASLSALGPGVTVIVIAHRLSTVQHSDIVHVVEGGRISASGKFSALRKTVPMVAEYVKLMSFEEQ